MSQFVRRPWEYFEDEYLRRYYRSDELTIADMVSDLERSESSIRGRACKLGLTQPRVSDRAIVDALREFHPGWSDSEVARHLAQTGRVDRHRVGVIRRSLGLPDYVGSDHHRRRVAAKTREQLDRAGLESLAQVRCDRFAQWKRSLGWPESLTVRAVQALELFYRRGPMTRMQLCAAMGIDKKRRLKRTEPTSNAKGGTVLAELQRAGLLMRLPKQVRSGTCRNGVVRKVDLYLLNPGVEPSEQRSITASRSG